MSKDKESSKKQKEKTLSMKLKAKITLNPSYNAAATIMAYTKFFGEQNIDDLTMELMEISDKELNDKTLNYSEEMLLSQAHTLQAIFTNLSRRAIIAEYIDTLERYLRLALKAQSQGARTLEILGAIRNPAQVSFVKQANIGQAVQVNNGTPPPIAATAESTRARENLNSSNELLEVKDGQRLDTGTTGTTSYIDSHMETVEQVNGAKDSKR